MVGKLAPNITISLGHVNLKHFMTLITVIFYICNVLFHVRDGLHPQCLLNIELGS